MKKILFAFLSLLILNLQSQNIVKYNCESCDYKDKVNGKWTLDWKGAYTCKLSVVIDYNLKKFTFTSYDGSVKAYKIIELIRQGKNIYGLPELIVKCIDSEYNECKIHYTLEDNKYILAVIYIEYNNRMFFYSLT
jgi:hypothetical protein